MKIGIIAVGRDCAGVIDEVLQPWINLMEEYNIRLCLISATFREMESLGIPPEPDKETVAKINGYAMRYPANVSSVIFKQYADEASVREKGREILMAGDVKADIIWLLDMSDEFYTIKEIERIIRFVESKNFIAWFKISLKNYVFDTSTYLVNPFQPPRIWRTYYGDKKLSECSYDNDFVYEFLDNRQESISDKTLPHVTIPPSIAFIRHNTWLNDSRSKMKVAYQSLHFSHGAGCSFAWDDFKGGLIWNNDYFARTRQEIPEIAKE